MIDRKTILILIITALAFLLKNHYVLEFKEVINLIIKVSFFALIFFTFLKIDFSKLKQIKNYLFPLSFLFLIDYIVFPLFLFLLIKLFPQNIHSWIALLFLITAPAAISSIYITNLVHGDKEESLIAVVITHLAYILALPLILTFFEEFTGKINFDIMLIIKTLMIFIAFPMLLAYLVKKLKLKINVNPNLPFYLLLIVIFFTINLNSRDLSLNIFSYLEEILLILTYLTVVLAVVRFFSKRFKKELVLELFYKNYVIVLVLLSSFDKEYLILPIIYILLVNIFLGFYISIFENQ